MAKQKPKTEVPVEKFTERHLPNGWVDGAETTRIYHETGVLPVMKEKHNGSWRYKYA